MLALLFVAAIAPPSELGAYVNRPDPSFRARVTERSGAYPTRIALTSQTWHGSVWKHDVVIAIPKSGVTSAICGLCVTGDKPNVKDQRDAQWLADSTGMAIATLYQIPNQPLWGTKEDGLIALSFQKYLSTGDATWPALFPMAKSVIAAMDAIEKSTAKPDRLSKFAVFGGSKRGWTTWLAAASGDRRIVGIAPIVFDNLGIVRQMERQRDFMKSFSPMIRDYTNAGLLDVLKSQSGQKLAAMVDPLSYVPKIRVPVFAIHGGNDPFWAPGSQATYWDALKMPKSTLVVPNVGHTLGDKRLAMDALAAFLRSLQSGAMMPVVDGGLVRRNGGLQFVGTARGLTPQKMSVWVMSFNAWDFEKAPWRKIVEKSNVASIQFPMMPPQEGSAALLVLAEFKRGGRTFTVSCPEVILKAN